MLKIFNTLSGQKEEFKPRDPAGKKVQMFVCGPTVYDYIHIGNARTFVVFDVVAKYLRYRGYDLNYIQNITDIDNKVIERAEKEGIDSLEYAKKYSDIFKKDMQVLGVTAPEYKSATDHIPEVIKQVQTLLDKGNAYMIDNDGIYFDLATFPDYGKLSGRTASMADDAVSRIDDSDKKRNRGDFALWKFSQHNDPSWPAQFGNGRPGWHIEDTSITNKYFGPQYDIHGGGQDLIFPHHEAEIAQQESASSLKPFVKYWMHSGFLVNKSEKMSKSLGNFMTLHEALEKYSPEVLRFYFLSNHYHSPLDYSQELVKNAVAAVQRLGEFRNRIFALDASGQIDTKNDSAVAAAVVIFSKNLKEAMDDDFNTAKAFATIFSFTNAINGAYADKQIDKTTLEMIKKIIQLINNLFGIVPENSLILPDDIEQLVNKRQHARNNKQFDIADQLREEIKILGYEVEDTIYGPLVIKK